MDAHFEGSLMAHHRTGMKITRGGRLGGRSWVTIDVLPDVALLEIFDFCLDEDLEVDWHTLVHVCQNWRNIIFGSARRLNLQLRCTAGTRMREMPDIWPPLPIVVESDGHDKWGVDNIVAALEHNDRIISIHLWPLGVTFSTSQMEEILAAMQQPFPALIDVELESAPVDFASFFGGSAPCLQELCLNLITFPGFPKLLLSATNLVRLNLVEIRHSGYFSPEDLVTCLSVSTRLDSLNIKFESRQSRPDRQLPPPQTRTLLPVLTELEFKGAIEYLEDLVARIDTPLLEWLTISVFHEQIFDTPHLNQFIRRTPNFGARNSAFVDFIPGLGPTPGVRVTLHKPSAEEQSVVFKLGILSKQPDWQLSSLARLCSSSFPQGFFSVVESLYITGEFSRPHWQDDIEIGQWLELFNPFTAVNELYISRDFAPSVALVLEELDGERVTEVLPALQTLLFEEPLPSGPVTVLEIIGEFIAARELVGHPIAVCSWERGWRAHHGPAKKLTEGDRSWVTIDMLHDVTLLEIFCLCLDKDPERWFTLIHVCQKWRNIIFGSARCLGLRLCCTAGTPVREMLDIWPPLPIVIESDGHDKWGIDNIVAALEHNDRMTRIDLWTYGDKFSTSEMEQILAVMQQPFPALRDLRLRADEAAPVDFASFLGGSAPRLQVLALDRITLPGIPKLLLSATHLVRLALLEISDSGYISPEDMVTCLSMLTRLEKLNIDFKSHQSRPDRRHPPPQTRALLPVLNRLVFDGACEYLEDLVARIDTPLLKYLTITFFHQQIFNTPHLSQFISRTPKFGAHDEACVDFTQWGVWVKLPQTYDGLLKLGISSRNPDWQLSSLAQLCSSSFPQGVIPVVERLYVMGEFSRLHWQDDIEISQWLELFHPFTAVKYLRISENFSPSVALVLQELDGERVTEVLPALQTLFLEEPLPSGPILEIIEEFVAARELVGHPIAVSRGRGMQFRPFDFDMWYMFL